MQLVKLDVGIMVHRVDVLQGAVSVRTGGHQMQLLRQLISTSTSLSSHGAGIELTETE
jgi:hypothetical protein